MFIKKNTGNDDTICTCEIIDACRLKQNIKANIISFESSTTIGYLYQTKIEYIF